MIREFKRRIKLYKPTYVLELTTDSYSYLNVAKCVFCKEESFYVVASYYTAAWISPNPLGPTGSPDEGSLDSIACVAEYSSKSAALDAYKRLPKAPDLERISAEVCREAQRRYIKVFSCIQGTDEIEWSLVSLPLPTLLATVHSSNGVLQGSIALPLSGRPFVVMSCNERAMRQYLRFLSEVASPWYSGENLHIMRLEE